MQCNADVLLGRGSGCNNHIGNIRFREYVDKHQEEYHNSCKSDKPLVAMKIVYLWKNSKPHNGRFLSKKKCDSKNCDHGSLSDGWEYYEIDDELAMKKVAQRLREGKNAALLKKDSGSNNHHHSSCPSLFKLKNKMNISTKQKQEKRRHSFTEDRRTTSTRLRPHGLVKRRQSFLEFYRSDSESDMSAILSSTSRIGGSRDQHEDVARSLAELKDYFQWPSPGGASLSRRSSFTTDVPEASYGMECGNADTTESSEVEACPVPSLFVGCDENFGTSLPLAASLVALFEDE